MATIALSLAGQAIGGLFGGPIGATIGRAIGALAGSAIDNALFGNNGSAPPALGANIRLQGSREGGAVPRIYGWTRLTGNVIWATELERHAAQTSGSKGAPPSNNSEDTILASFAVALCEGEVGHLGRIWVDGQLLNPDDVTFRFYTGSENQPVDSLIAAKQGAGNAPAYRGTCYIVFEAMPLNPYGKRIPNISVELCRLVGDLEPQVRAITVIPGASEFGYDPKARVRVLSPGVTQSENAHLRGDVSDWTYSIDELHSLCPNLEHVALVVAWFGDDLRCGSCAVEPRVEGHDRTILDTAWSVDGLTREAAKLVSLSGDGPAYGGTPSDNAVRAAIADLKARGLKVTLYPIILMDVPDGNDLIDPYTQAVGQKPYPWRGRITCDPAIGQIGSPDQTALAGTQIATFVSGGAWHYRRMILHYAQLCVDAGGVDAFLIGSEMRGLSQVRQSASSFPFVDALVALAADVRAIVGGTTRLTYAADWSEYSGYQPPDAPGDKFFHLDLLWSNANIDAIGIDNYMPISDWRDDADQVDAGAGSIYNLDYLRTNIVSGEGFDWYYASHEDRMAQIRSPITDGAHAEPWIWRFKDLKSFWSETHFNRISGIRSGTPTAWVPEAKPFWFTELGCGAVDKGSNLPSAFADPKSSEDAKPYFSSGAPDALMQRQFLRAHLQHWGPDSATFNEAHNPLSSTYAGRMVDPDRIYLWTWDARPFPAFPAQADVWADAANHSNGHWLTGRLGGLSIDELIAALAKDYGVTFRSVDAAGPQVQGLLLEGMPALRHVLEPILAGTNLAIINTAHGLECRRQTGHVSHDLDKDDLIGSDGVRLREKWPSSGETPAQLALSYADRTRDYQEASVTAIAPDGASSLAQTSRMVMAFPAASTFCANSLNNARQGPKTLEFSLPPSFAALEIGDAIQIKGRKGPAMIVTQIRDGVFREISARPAPIATAIRASGDGRGVITASPENIAIPEIVLAHVPNDAVAGPATSLVAGAFAQPWPGRIRFHDTISNAHIGTLNQAAALGKTQSALSVGSAHLWDQSQELIITLFNGHLASETDLSTLVGANRLLVQHGDGAWEILGFAKADLTGPNTYRLSRLLRHLAGSADAGTGIDAGAPLMVVNTSLLTTEISDQKLGETYALTALIGPHDPQGTTLTMPLLLALAQPLPPTHLRTMRDHTNGDVALKWVRRTRRGGDGWAALDVPLDATPETYRVTIFDGVTPLRELITHTPNVLYALSDQLADFGVLPVTFNFEIAQINQTFGAGISAKGIFND